MPVPPAASLAALRRHGIGRGSLLAVASWPDAGVAFVAGDLRLVVSATSAESAALVATIDDELAPRWVVWTRHQSATLLRQGATLSSCWDIAAVHRLAVGGWRAEPARVWAHHRELDPAAIPEHRGGDPAVVDLFTAAEQTTGDADDPIRPDGHLRPDWGRPGWEPTPPQLEQWVALAFEIGTAQIAGREHLAGHPRAPLVARSESTAELLCNELAVSGLPIDLGVAEELLQAQIGPRPASEGDAAAQRRERDVAVLRHVPGDDAIDLRSAGQVKSLLRRCGIEVEDTRAWRLEPLIGTHPVVEPLLRWRKAERLATTFGYSWLDEHRGADGRLRGEWTGTDGAAGRMTASAGLHNMPSDLRPAVIAEPGHLFVRSDLGQIEPRVLAAVSLDARLARASRVADLYAGVADTLAVEREIAKVAVLGAMYGQTTGRGAQALAELRRAYPVAMAYLDHADAEARTGRDVRTYGGRRIRMDAGGDHELPERAARSRAAARGRYGRNAVIQGAAAELFKMWAVTVRSRTRMLGAEIVLCLHDELLVHAPVDVAREVATLVDASLQEAVRRWAPDDSVRFLADTSIIARWSDAKD